jgi:hypothetical protein
MVAWDSYSGMTCLGVEIVKKIGVRGTGVEVAFTMLGHRRDAKATPAG